MEHGEVRSVSASPVHAFSKDVRESIHVVAGLGVEGDAHAGTTVQHRSRKRAFPDMANLRQVHLLPEELLDEVAACGHTVRPGDLGENVLTRGIDLVRLPKGTRLHLGPDVVCEVTGLRNPCSQIEHFQAGLLALMTEQMPDGSLFRKAGVMTVALTDGDVRPGDAIRVELPPEPWEKLDRV